jgi:hypothetical protein
MLLKATRIFPSEENPLDIVPSLFSPSERNHARSDLLNPP